MLMRMKRDAEKGDTIIEVLFATAAMSLIIVIAFLVMNRGVASAQIAVENTFARQGIDGQAESLRFLRDAYLEMEEPSGNVKTQWERILNRTAASATPFGECNPPLNAFYINTDTVSVHEDVEPAQTFAGAEFGQGMWVEAVRPAAAPGREQYIDFHIRACWEPPASGPTITTGTIVRLYIAEGAS